jgi:hypothetical protein
MPMLHAAKLAGVGADGVIEAPHDLIPWLETSGRL